jgi:hypothetical protein
VFFYYDFGPKFKKIIIISQNLAGICYVKSEYVVRSGTKWVKIPTKWGEPECLWVNICIPLMPRVGL